MTSLLVSVTVPGHDEDALVTLLYECGAVGVEVQNFESDPVTLRAFFPSSFSDDLGRVLQHLMPKLPPSAQQTVSTATVPDEDWQKRWRESLQPFAVGQTFLVLPSSNVEVESGSRTQIFIEPGMAFGTGTHESTQLCLEALEKLPIRGKTVLDVGTGAGILAIAAALRGAGVVWACDLDPVAVSVARTNSSRNGVSSRVHAWVGSLDAVRPLGAPICVANLTARIFENLWTEFTRVLPTHGILICSGILKEQGRIFQEQLQHHSFRVERADTANDWISFVACKE